MFELLYIEYILEPFLSLGGRAIAVLLTRRYGFELHTSSSYDGYQSWLINRQCWIGWETFSRRRPSRYNYLEENSDVTSYSGSFDFRILADPLLILPPALITNVVDITLKSAVTSVSIQ